MAAVAVVANWPILSKPLMMAITETNLAAALQADGRPRDAIEHYQRAIALQPDYAPAYNNLGVARRAAGDLDQAIAAYERAVAMKPDYPDAHYNLANALLDKNKPQEAEEHFRIALQSIPDSAGVRNNLGIALAAAGKGDDAVAAFRAAVAAEPGSAKAHRNLADALSAAGHMAEAFTEFQRAAELDPNDATTHYNFGSTLLDAGRFDDAIGEFRAALRIIEAPGIEQRAAEVVVHRSIVGSSSAVWNSVNASVMCPAAESASARLRCVWPSPARRRLRRETLPPSSPSRGGERDAEIVPDARRMLESTRAIRKCSSLPAVVRGAHSPGCSARRGIPASSLPAALQYTTMA